MNDATYTAVCTVVAQSPQVRHVLVQEQGGQLYAVTANTFAGDWGALRHGDVLELVVTLERLPRTLSARLLATHEGGPVSPLETESRVGRVLGKGTDTPYVLVECPDADQYVVNRKVFEGDWDALQRGDVVALTVTPGLAGRVVNARLFDFSGGSPQS